MGLELFGRFTGLTRGVRRLDAGTLDLCYMAAGRLDGYYERDLSAWDVVASSLLVEEVAASHGLPGTRVRLATGHVGDGGEQRPFASSARECHKRR